MYRPASIFLLACTLAPTLAIAAPPPPGRAVDMAVGDLDSLSTSMRQVQVGLRNNGEQSNLFQVVQPNSDRPTYQRIGPGFRANVDRMSYLVRVDRKNLGTNIAPRHDGEFREIIPANTVFDLRPQSPTASNFPSPASGGGREGAAPRMIQAQIDTRIDGRVDAQIR